MPETQKIPTPLYIMIGIITLAAVLWIGNQLVAADDSLKRCDEARERADYLLHNSSLTPDSTPEEIRARSDELQRASDKMEAACD